MATWKSSRLFKICSNPHCSSERKPLPQDHFYQQKTGLSGHCKICFRTRIKAYRDVNKDKLRVRSKLRYAVNAKKFRAEKRKKYAENPELYKERNRQRYLACPEYFLAINKRYAEAHKASIAAKRRAHGIKNAEQIRQKKRIYRSNNRERIRMLNKRRRAIKLGVALNDFTAAQWKALKAAYNYRCAYCSKKPKKLTMDHITPLSQGGGHTLANIVPACQSCNSRKRTGPVLKPIQPLLLVI